MEWAQRQAMSRIFSIEEMRQYLRSAGDDKEKAEEYLPQLDELTRKTGGSRALQLVGMQLRYQERSRIELKPEAKPDVVVDKLAYTPPSLGVSYHAQSYPTVYLSSIEADISYDPPIERTSKQRSKSGQRNANKQKGRAIAGSAFRRRH